MTIPALVSDSNVPTILDPRLRMNPILTRKPIRGIETALRSNPLPIKPVPELPPQNLLDNFPARY